MYLYVRHVYVHEFNSQKTSSELYGAERVAFFIAPKVCSQTNTIYTTIRLVMTCGGREGGREGGEGVVIQKLYSHSNTRNNR